MSPHDLAGDPSGALPPAPASASTDVTGQLLALTGRIAQRPGEALQALIAVALEATGAHASGLSLVSRTATDEEVFRWVATAGDLAPFLGATMPRHASPCGLVLRRRALTWIVQPARHFPDVQGLGLSLSEVLLAPFAFDGRPQGTLWVTSRDGSKRFHRGDGRVLEDLADFVGQSSELLQRLGVRSLA